MENKEEAAKHLAKQLVGGMSRREFVRKAAVLGLSGAVMTSILAACARATGVTTTTAASVLTSTTGASAASTTIAPSRSGLAQIAVTGWNVDKVLDPVVASGVPELLWGGLMFDNLVTLTQSFELLPGLAESWEINDDATLFTYSLREAEFHNGAPFTARDVVHTFQRVLDPELGSSAQGSLSSFLEPSGITALDDRTVQFRLTTSNSFFPIQLAGFNSRIVPEGWNAGDPIGTGPFRFVEMIPGQVFSAEANPGYWVADRPLLEGVRLVNIPDDSTRVQSVLSGDSHLATTIQAVAAQEVLDSGSAKLEAASNAFFPVIVVRRGMDPALDNPDAIRGLKHAMNRESLLETVQLGYGSVGADMPVPTDDTFYPSGYEPIGYDPDEARRLLEGAGVSEITVFAAPVGPGVVELPVTFADQAREIGLTVNIERVPADTYWSTAYLNEPVFMSYWARQHASVIVPQSMSTDGVWNEPAYANDVVDGLIAEAAGAPELERQKSLYGEALSTFADEAGWLIPFWQDSLWPAKQELQDVEFDWINLANMRDARLA